MEPYNTIVVPFCLSLRISLSLSLHVPSLGNSPLSKWNTRGWFFQVCKIHCILYFIGVQISNPNSLHWLDCVVAVADVGLLCWETWKRRMKGQIEKQNNSMLLSVTWKVEKLVTYYDCLKIDQRGCITMCQVPVFAVQAFTHIYIYSIYIYFYLIWNWEIFNSRQLLFINDERYCQNRQGGL